MGTTRREWDYWEKRAERAVTALARLVVNVMNEELILDVEARMLGEESVMDRWREDPRFRAELAEEMLDKLGSGIGYAEWDADLRFPWGLIPPEEEVGDHWGERPSDSAWEPRGTKNLARVAARADSHPMSARFHLAQRDAVAWLASLPPGSVDLVITDPPYESLEKHRAKGTTTRLKHSKASSNDWFTVFPNARFDELFAAVHRALKPNAHFYLFCDSETMFFTKPLGEAAGFKFWKPIIWDKRKIGMGYHYRARYECILFFEKGKRRLNNLGVADVIEAPRVFNGYPTEKPVTVGEVLVGQSSAPGDLVADPFMGSGAFGVAALRGGRHFVGSDTSGTACGVARLRLVEEGGRADPTLFPPLCGEAEAG